ncbi:MAG TPA: alpha/beta hydrolase [Kofleriaceae bacterium]|nr:alpha/beta hydrolase [Kofleriaceae bacterium]
MADGSPIFYTLDANPLEGSRADPGAEGRTAGCARSAPPALLLDGIGCDGFVWKYLAPALTGQRSVLHMCYRGHGRTPRPRDLSRITIADLADDAASVLADAEAGAAVLIGHSMGVQVALETTRRHRDRVAALILVCGAPGEVLRTFRGTGAFAAALPRARAAVERAPRLWSRALRSLLPTRAAFAIAAQLEIRADLLERDDFMPYLEGMARVDADLFLAMLEGANSHSARPFLATIDVPVLIVAGDRDGFTPPGLSREMAAEIPGAELFMVAGGSHTAPIERPKEVTAAIVSFISRLGIAELPEKIEFPKKI